MFKKKKSSAPALSAEDIYQLLAQKKFTEIMEIISEQRQNLNSDPGLQNAIFVFVNEVYRGIQLTGWSDESNHILDTLFIIHTQQFFRLPDQLAIHLISLLEGRVSRQDLYKGAKEYPEDPLCQEIIKDQELKIAPTALTNPATESRTFRSPPGLKFESEIKVIENGFPYLKIFLRTNYDFDLIAAHINKLPTVKRANVTERNGKKDLTIYNQRPYAIEETKDEVELTLNNYFSRNENDPVFQVETFSEISAVAYYQILDYILHLGKSLEGPRRISEKWDEERYRDFFVLYLDSLSKKHSATGETFHGIGKTDILFRNQEKENLLVAECKLWGGSTHLSNALDQLFERYLNWRDAKAAIIIFNTKVSGFTKLLETAVNEVQKHPLHLRFVGKRAESSYSFHFKNKNDPDKVIKLELLVFNFV